MPRPDRTPPAALPGTGALQRSDTEIDTDPGHDPTERTTDWELAIVPVPDALDLPVDRDELVGILMVVEAEGGPIRLVHTLRRRDRLERLLNQAALDPAPGAEPAWPRRIRVVDPDLARALEGAEANVVVVEALPTLEQVAGGRLLVQELTDAGDPDDDEDDYTSDEPMPELVDADHLLLVDGAGEQPCLTFQLRKRDAERLARDLGDLTSVLVVGDPSGGVHVVACRTGGTDRRGDPPIGLLTFIEASTFAATLSRHVTGEAATVRLRIADGGVSKAKPAATFLLDRVLPASAATA